MSFILRIKRRLTGEPGPPCELAPGELAFNETEGVLYIGTSRVVDLSGADVVSVSACSGE